MTFDCGVEFNQEKLQELFLSKLLNGEHGRAKLPHQWQVLFDNEATIFKRR